MHGDSTAGSREASHNDVVILQLHGDAAARVVWAGSDIDGTPAWILLLLHTISGLQHSRDHKLRTQRPEMIGIARQGKKAWSQLEYLHEPVGLLTVTAR